MSAVVGESSSVSPDTSVDPLAPVWWVAVMGGQYGPYRQVDLVQMMRAHQIDGETLTWHKGMETWTPMRAVEQLAADLPAAVEEKVPTGKASIPPKGYGFLGLVAKFSGAALRMDDSLAEVHDYLRGAWGCIIAGALSLLFYFSVWAGWPSGIAHGGITMTLGLLALFAGIYAGCRLCIRDRVEWRFVWSAFALVLVPLIPAALIGGALGLVSRLALWLLAPGVVMSGLVLMQYFIRAHKTLALRASRGALVSLTAMVLAIGILQAYILSSSSAASSSMVATSDGSEPMPVGGDGPIELGGAVSAPTAPPSFSGGDDGGNDGL